MSNKSNYTKGLQKKLWALRIIDWIFLLTPIFVFFVIGLTKETGLVYQKIALVGTFVLAGILTIFNILAKRHLRSIIWIMIIGLYVALDNILPLIICIAVATVLDEFLFTPLVEHYKIKYISSKTGDDKIAYEAKGK